MRKFLRLIPTLFKNGYAWFLDYLYVSYWQIHSLLIRINEDTYRQKQQGKAIPIILIPGIYENWRFMKPIADLLYKKGYDIHVVNELKYNTGTIEEMAELVKQYILSHSISKCVIVAHSKGGLIGKYLLSNSGNSQTIKGMIALNTPFSGSRYAYLIPKKSIRIFLPKSPILSQLASNTEVNRYIISIYGLFDPHVPKGSHLQGAKNIQLRTRGHFRVMNNSVVHSTILKELATFED